MFRVYYHLYLGASWRDVWAIHRPVLERGARTGLIHRLIVCVCGDAPFNVDTVGMEAEIVHLAAGAKSNEFQTLALMRRDALDPRIEFDHCAYMHSKGSSSGRLGPAGAEWSLFLATALCRALPWFASVSESGFNAIGSNLALGIFEDFGIPRLHYSGNFWGATRALVAAAPPIELGGRHAAVRHNAEWWLGAAPVFTPFNVFSTGVDHYTEAAGCVDWDRLDAILDSKPLIAPPQRDLRRIAFMAAMLRRATGTQPVRRALSEALLGTLPYHRWPRLLNVHHLLMQGAGSRKSTYLFCPESAGFPR